MRPRLRVARGGGRERKRVLVMFSHDLYSFRSQCEREQLYDGRYQGRALLLAVLTSGRGQLKVT